MKNTRILLAVVFSIMIYCNLILTGCTNENTPEPVTVDFPPVGSDKYYENLRAYKKTPHQIAFGWYGSSGATNLEPSMQSRWMGLPDSLDIISMWGGFPEKDSPSYKEMRFVQEVKGTKIVRVNFTNDDFFNYNIKDFKATYFDGQTKEKLKEGFDKIAQKIYTEVSSSGVDGIDFDHEPNYCSCNTWQITKNSSDFGLFIEALGKYFGREAGTGKMLLIDGEIDKVPTSAGRHVNYAVTQSYGTSSQNILQSRYDEIASWATPERYIVTENFESLWKTGGLNFRDPVNGIIPGIYGLAYWNPIQGSKGGAGSYHIEYDYGNFPGYKYTRKMIQIMNPAPKPK
ncbi:glycoside hydrolase family 18 [Elizabethkingia anophelis]|uniref:glycoside hydrolase family 18 n=1 Tax=Elizabethkingia anophelis TaxID=1117645 RepID=UPI001628A7C4|nr:glycoside hydrolase family 18 [Elizabethkingia anophelis]MCT4323308.1 glycosyl hydrolase family 18,F5/8 type C domain-containing protein [Elizabethkingia anophelis]HAY3536223.1 glycosyl hydrolase family 18,F5/8 type C domain-containing protein [Elizabethkingia anophelis]HAY3548440.1 glycosyl hydrolase family 18,F5/8 type C domain-containing protein [Elizabethkingia anophelis]HAY3593184.1 glycosyl hydrolase family 18,F5/8 type C domain-containing protein [Elizabethkingia anophelis]